MKYNKRQDFDYRCAFRSIGVQGVRETGKERERERSAFTTQQLSAAKLTRAEAPGFQPH